ncbi:hypothetical protein BK142_14080 [Paenibacillus glucanolyticus]|nr:hypothetical protein BK142_14080 [Paenibacillus glucanolyticus]
MSRITGVMYVIVNVLQKIIRRQVVENVVLMSRSTGRKLKNKNKRAKRLTPGSLLLFFFIRKLQYLHFNEGRYILYGH